MICKWNKKCTFCKNTIQHFKPELKWNLTMSTLGFFLLNLNFKDLCIQINRFYLRLTDSIFVKGTGCLRSSRGKEDQGTSLKCRALGTLGQFDDAPSLVQLPVDRVTEWRVGDECVCVDCGRLLIYTTMDGRAATSYCCHSRHDGKPGSRSFSFRRNTKWPPWLWHVFCFLVSNALHKG